MALKQCYNQHTNLDLNQLVQKLDTSLQGYITHETERLSKDNLNESIELLLKPSCFKQRLPEGSRNSLELLQRKLNNILNTTIHDLHIFGDNERKQISKMLEKGADFNDKGDNEYSAYQRTILKNFVNGAELMLERGANPNIIFDRENQTALALSVSQNFKDMTRCLIKAGADVNKTCPPRSDPWAPDPRISCIIYSAPPLIIAAEKDFKEQAQILLSHGADVNAINEISGDTALLTAIERDNYKIYELILKEHIDKIDINYANKSGSTALMLAADFVSDFELVNDLIHLGADVFKQDNDGRSALDIAMCRYSKVDKFYPEDSVDEKWCLEEEIVSILEKTEQAQRNKSMSL